MAMFIYINPLALERDI